MDRKRRIDLSDVNSAKRSRGAEGLNPLNGHPFSAKYHDLFAVRQKLPVYQFINELCENVRKNQITIVEGETGSGKTTQVCAAAGHVLLAAPQRQPA